MGAAHLESMTGPRRARLDRSRLERETGFAPPTPSLEGWRSNAELFPVVMVARGGFDPPKAFASRFTVCPLWPLGYLAIRFVIAPGLGCARRRNGPSRRVGDARSVHTNWSWRRDLNPRPAAYK